MVEAKERISELIEEKNNYLQMQQIQFWER